MSQPPTNQPTTCACAVLWFAVARLLLLRSFYYFLPLVLCCFCCYCYGCCFCCCFDSGQASYISVTCLNASTRAHVCSLSLSFPLSPPLSLSSSFSHSCGRQLTNVANAEVMQLLLASPILFAFFSHERIKPPPSSTNTCALYDDADGYVVL